MVKAGHAFDACNTRYNGVAPFNFAGFQRFFEPSLYSCIFFILKEVLYVCCIAAQYLAQKNDLLAFQVSVFGHAVETLVTAFRVSTITVIFR